VSLSRRPGVGTARRAGFRGIGGGGAPPPWTPLTDSPALWLRGDDRVMASSKVATWTDKSGNGRNYTQGTDANRPTVGTLGGQDAIVFSRAAATVLLGPSLSGLTAAHLFVVVAVDSDPPPPDSPGNNNTGAWQFSTTTFATHFPLSDGVVYEQFGTSARKTIGNPTPSLAALRLYEVVSVAGEFTARLDGTQIYTTGTNTVEWRAVETSIGGSIDVSGSAGAVRMNGKIAEFIVYPSKRNATQLANVYAYLEDRYTGMVLP